MSNDSVDETEQEATDGSELDSQDASPDESTFDQTLESAVASAADSQVESDSGTDAAEASNPNWQQELESAGFKSFDDIDKAVEALVQRDQQREQQIQQYTDQLKFYQDQARFSQQQQQASPQPAPESVVESNDPLDPLSEILDGWEDPAWANQYIEVDEDGNRVISDRADEETREKIVSIDRKMRQFQEKVNNPASLAEIIDKRVEKMIQDRFEDSYSQKQTEAQEQAAVDGFLQSNAEWLYQRDPATGQYVTDPMSGQYIYSQQGNQFLDYMDGFAQDGVANVIKQIEYASRLMQPSQQQQQPAQQEAPTADQRRREMQARKNSTQSTQQTFNGVTSVDGGPTGQNAMSFGEETLQAMLNGTE